MGYVTHEQARAAIEALRDPLAANDDAVDRALATLAEPSAHEGETHEFVCGGDYRDGFQFRDPPGREDVCRSSPECVCAVPGCGKPYSHAIHNTEAKAPRGENDCGGVEGHARFDGVSGGSVSSAGTLAREGSLSDDSAASSVATAAGPAQAGIKPGPQSLPKQYGPDHGACYICNRRYGDEYGFPDLMLPDDAWRAISPYRDSRGLLCPSCICARLWSARVATTATWESGPLCSPQSPVSSAVATAQEGPEPDFRIITNNVLAGYVGAFPFTRDIMHRAIFAALEKAAEWYKTAFERERERADLWHKRACEDSDAVAVAEAEVASLQSRLSALSAPVEGLPPDPGHNTHWDGTQWVIKPDYDSLRCTAATLINQQRAENERLDADLQELRERNADLQHAYDAAREDIVAAVGELLVPMPAPGTDMARVMLANAAMRRERDAALAELEAIKAGQENLSKSRTEA